MDAKDFARRAARFAKRTLGPEGTIRTGPRSFGASRSAGDRSTVPTPPPHERPAPPRAAVFDSYTEPGELPALGVLLMPLAEYHGKELGAVADALRDRGQLASFLVEEDKVEVIDRHLGTHPRVLASAGYDRFALGNFEAFVAMNDWGAPSRAIYHLARVRGVPSFAKVEGVQDFDDIDTGRIRLPYLAADHVLVQGNNDIAALDRRNLHVVGNANMEAAWETGPTAGGRNGEVVINSNFTYGVLTDVRDSFLHEAVSSIQSLGLVPIISQHPADLQLPPELATYRTDRSMSDMLPGCEAIVTRFSTVPFEAIAYGTPFVYFNPHGEQVPAFGDPDPAFEHVRSAADLGPALSRAIDSRPSYRQVAEPYFRSQIDMNGTPSAARAAAVISAVLKNMRTSH